ncbi:hypothetical protein GmHk_15G045004 [Glycine max]|nr:hypothetical protein GmHk_15G045004 [Glycine max]
MSSNVYDSNVLLMWKGQEYLYLNPEFLLKSIDLSSNDLTESPGEDSFRPLVPLLLKEIPIFVVNHLTKASLEMTQQQSLKDQQFMEPVLPGCFLRARGIGLMPMIDWSHAFSGYPGQSFQRIQILTFIVGLHISDEHVVWEDIHEQRALNVFLVVGDCVLVGFQEQKSPRKKNPVFGPLGMIIKVLRKEVQSSKNLCV